MFDIGNYNINQLFSHLHTKLQETQDTQDIVINWSSLSNKMTFTGTAPIQLNPISTCHALLGFSPDTIHGTITYAPFQALCAKVSRNHIERFRLYITDENGNHINFNCMKWTTTLRIDLMTPAKLKPDTESSDAFLTLSRAPPNVRDYITM